MEGIEPRRVYEVQRWLGLFPHDQPEGLHGDRRIQIVARHTRVNKGAPPQLIRLASFRGATRTVTIHAGEWVYLSDAIARTYPRSRESHVMALLRPQPLSDRLWRMIYALMVTGGPLLLSELIAFLARLTSPKEIAEPSAVALYQRWSKAAHA